MYWFETDPVDTWFLSAQTPLPLKQLLCAIISHRIQIRTKVIQIWSALIVHKCLWNIIWGISVSISELENCFEWRTIISIIILILQHSKCPLSPSSHKVFTKPHLHQSSDKLIVFRDSTLDSWKFRESRIETQVTVNLLLSSTVLKWYLFHLIISGANRFRGTWSN